MKNFFKKAWTNTTTFVSCHKTEFEIAAVSILSIAIGFGLKGLMDGNSSEAPVYQINLDDIPNNVDE